MNPYNKINGAIMRTSLFSNLKLKPTEILKYFFKYFYRKFKQSNFFLNEATIWILEKSPLIMCLNKINIKKINSQLHQLAVFSKFDLKLIAIKNNLCT